MSLGAHAQTQHQHEFETKYAATTLSPVDANGVFSGYASLFHQVDLGQDAVAPGAFHKSIGNRGVAGIKMLFQHDPSQVLGTWLDIKEDAEGLFVRGRLAAGVTRADEVRTLMQAGALDGLSIGFKTIKSRKIAKTGVRMLTEVDLWEISIVTFPMLPEARVGAARLQNAQQEKRRPTIREFERWLTRDAGLSRREAHTIIHSGFKHLTRLRDAAPNSRKMGPDKMARLQSQLKRATNLLSNKQVNQ